MRCSNRRAWALAALLATFFVSVYLLTESADLHGNGDTVFRYQTTQSIVEQHHLWIAHPIGLDQRVVRGNGGHLYAFYAPGQTIFMIPFYVLGKVVAHHFGLSYDVVTRYTTRSLDLFLGAALAVLLFLFAISIGYSLRVSALLALILALTTPAWPDAQSALEQTQVDFFLLLAVYSSWRAARDDRQRHRWLILAGTAAGLTVLTRYDAILFVPLVGLYPALVRYVRFTLREASKDFGLYLCAVLPWGLAILAWDWLRFGSIFNTGLHERTFGEPPWAGLTGLLVSPGKGFLWYMPLALLVPFVARPFYHRTGGLSFFLLTIVLATLLFYSNVLFWHGDPAWGPRYLYTSLPYLVLPLGEVLSSWRVFPRPGKLAFTILTLAGLALSLAAISVTQWRFWYRLESQEQATVNASSWAGQPFHWGSQKYHYYWNPKQSPILLQIDDVYQVLRLDVLGEQRYRLRLQPDPYVSNPATSYPVNTLNFWWADVRHPPFPPRARDALAGLLVISALFSALALLLVLKAPEGRKEGVSLRTGSSFAKGATS
jgi:hypothetical protein